MYYLFAGAIFQDETIVAWANVIAATIIGLGLLTVLVKNAKSKTKHGRPFGGWKNVSSILRQLLPYVLMAVLLRTLILWGLLRQVV